MAPPVGLAIQVDSAFLCFSFARIASPRTNSLPGARPPIPVRSAHNKMIFDVAK